MSYSYDYRTPRFIIDPSALPDNSIPSSKLQSGIPGSLLEDDSVPPGKLQSGISGSLLADNSVPPGKLQSGISGGLLLNDSVPLNALAPNVRRQLVSADRAPWANYPDTSIGLYRLINAFGAQSIGNAGTSILGTNVLMVIPIMTARSYTLSTAAVVCTSVTTAGSMLVGLYNDLGQQLSAWSRTIGGTGILTSTFSTAVNVQANTLYYLAFLITSGIFNLITVYHNLLEYIYITGTTANPISSMRFNATSLPTTLSFQTPRAEIGSQVPLFIQT